MLSLEGVDLVSDFILLDSDIVEVLLLNSLLFNSSFLEFELDSSLFLLNLCKLTLNIAVIDGAILIGLDLLEKGGLLGKFILACSLSSCSGRNVVLGGYISGL